MSTHSSEMPGEDPGEGKRKSARKSKKLRLEHRIRPEHARPGTIFEKWARQGWTLHHKKYSRPEQRRVALAALNRNDTLFEYRIPIGEQDGEKDI